MKTQTNLSSSKRSQQEIALIGFALCFSLAGGIGYLFDHTWMFVFIIVGAGLLILVHPFWGLLLFALLLPFESSYLGLSGGAASLTRYLGIGIFSIWLAHTRFGSLKMNFPSVMISALLLVFWGTVSVLWTINLGVTQSRLLTAVQLVLLFFLVANFVSNDKMLKALLIAVVTGCALVMLMGLFGIGVAENSELLTMGDTGAKEYGTYVGVVFLVASLFFFYQKGTWRWIGLVGVLLAMVTLIRVNQRGILLGIGIAWGAITLVSKQKFRTLLLILLVLLAFNFAADFLYQSGMIDDYLFERLTVQNVIETGGTGRLTIWSVGWRMFSDNFLTGVGWGNYPIAYQRYAQFSTSKNPIVLIESQVSKDPHNDIIGLAGELGLLGVVIFLVFYGKIAFESTKHLLNEGKREQSLIHLIVFGLMVYFFATGFTSSLLYRKMYWLILGMSFAFPKLDPPGIAEKTRKVDKSIE